MAQKQRSKLRSTQGVVEPSLLGSWHADEARAAEQAPLYESLL